MDILAAMHDACMLGACKDGYSRMFVPVCMHGRERECVCVCVTLCVCVCVTLQVID